MSTETIEQPETTPDADAPDVAAIRAEAAAVDPGPLATDDDTRDLYRYLRLRMYATAELVRLKEQTAAMVRDAERRVKDLDHVFTEQARRIAAEKLRGAKSKSLKTPFGTVKFRTVAPALVVLDASAVPSVFKRVKQEVVICKADLNTHWEQTGEVPPGCEITDEREEFYLPK